MTGAAQRRRGRRLRAAWRHEQQSIAQALATFTHHSSRGQRTARAGEWVSELNYAATIRRTPTPQTAGTQYFAMDVDEVPAVGGSRPDRVSDVSGPQERVQRRIVQQTIDVVPLPTLDAPVPQMVGQLAEVLVFFNATLPVLEVPKITVDQALRRSSLRDLQLVEQLVDVPVPRNVILARGTDIAGNTWCQVTEHQGRRWRAYWWMKGTRHVQWAPPVGYTASAGRYTNTGQGSGCGSCGRPCEHAAQAPAVLADLQWKYLRFRSSTECWTFL